ncbi:MAG TPA: EamA family transporter [Candidatus Paceibacterota bacterium]
MDTTTLLWTLAATISAGAQVFISKIVAHEHRDAAFNGMMMYGISGAIAALILIAHPWPHDWLLGALLGIFAGSIHSLGNYIRIESLKHIESVIYFPLNKLLGPLVVVVAAVVWFGDALTLREYIGIALSLTVPLFLISAGEHHRQKNLRFGLVLMVQSTILTSVSVLFSKEALVRTSDVLFIIGAAQLAGTLCSMAILSKQKGVRTMVSHIDRRDISLGLITGILAFASTYTLFEALSTGLVSIVYVIQAHYILIPIVLAVWWYKEHMNIRKGIAIVVSLLAISVLYSG